MRIIESAIKDEKLRAAFRAHGIADHCNALAKGARSRTVGVFVLLDGSTVPADSRVVAAVARSVK